MTIIQFVQVNFVFLRRVLFFYMDSENELEMKTPLPLKFKMEQVIKVTLDK